MSTLSKFNGAASSATAKPGGAQINHDAKQGTLTRQDIALAIYNRFGTISRREAKRLTDCVIDEMVATLTSGESLKLHDFGSFVVRAKHQRAGRNPRTGEPVPIEARRVVVFKASPNMKATVNGEAPPARGRAAAASSGAKGRKADRDGAPTTRKSADAGLLSETLAE